MSDPSEAGVSLANLLERLLVTRVRASGFPTATSLVCVVDDPTDWRRVNLVLDEVHDAAGLVAHAAHEHDRSIAAGEAFDRLVPAAQHELSHLSNLANLGQDEDYPYWGPVEIRFRVDGLEYVLSEWDDPPEANDWCVDTVASSSSQPPTLQDVAALEAVLLDRLQLAEQATAAEIARLTDLIIAYLSDVEPGIARVEVEVELFDWGHPRTWISGAYDSDGGELEVELEASDVDGLEDFVRTTETIGSLTIDVSAGTIS